MMDIHAIPAYGKDYKSKQAVILAWTNGLHAGKSSGECNAYYA